MGPGLGPDIADEVEFLGKDAESRPFFDSDLAALRPVRALQMGAGSKVRHRIRPAKVSTAVFAHAGVRTQGFAMAV